MTFISKNVYIDKLEYKVNKYNDTYHSAIKIKPVGVMSNSYINSNNKIDDKDCIFKIDQVVRISKY